MKVPVPRCCVAGVVTCQKETLLCVKRSKRPEIGKWTLPGGHIESGETSEQAVVREIFEETGLKVRSAFFLGLYEYLTPEDHIIILIFECEYSGGTATPGDDAKDVRWYRREELETLPKTDGLFEHVFALQDYRTQCPLS